MKTSLRSRLLAWAVVVACLTTLPGCGYTYHFRNSNMLKGEEHNEWASYFIFGLVGDYELNVKDFCPNGIYEVATGNNFVTWFLRVATIGIYSPRKVIIWCSAGASNASFDVQFGEDGRPARVTKTTGEARWSGEAKRTSDGRYAVMLEEGATP